MSYWESVAAASMESDWEARDREQAEASYAARKAMWERRLGEDAPTHESPSRLRRRAEWNEQEEADRAC